MDMNRRNLKNFFTKRSSMWTLSLCMTGAIVLGGIAAVDHVRLNEDNSENGYEHILPNETEEDLFYTLEEANLENGLYEEEPDAEEELAANAEGNVLSENGGEENYGSDSMTADTEERANADNGNTDSVPEESVAANADGRNSSGNDVVNADGRNTSGNTASNADGLTDKSSAETNADESMSQEAASSHIISEQALLDAGVSFEGEEALIWPSAGTILIDYSMDSSIYFPTLNQYKYNPALIIGSAVDNQVLAAAKGIVESVTIDEETGTTLVLNIGNGYRLTYGQLKDLTAEPGDVVEAGAVLGFVSEPTKYYSTEGSNLYFKMTKEDTPVDPVLYLE